MCIQTLYLDFAAGEVTIREPVLKQSHIQLSDLYTLSRKYISYATLHLKALDCLSCDNINVVHKTTIKSFNNQPFVVIYHGIESIYISSKSRYTSIFMLLAENAVGHANQLCGWSSFVHPAIRQTTILTCYRDTYGCIQDVPTSKCMSYFTSFASQQGEVTEAAIRGWLLTVTLARRESNTILCNCRYTSGHTLNVQNIK